MSALINSGDLQAYVVKNIGVFHDNRIAKLKELKLNTVLKKKNPYLFRVKDLTTAADLVRSILDAHLSSQEEGIFGNFLEGLAVYVNQKVYGGQKSAAEGIDLEFEKHGVRYIVSIKSGPNWETVRRLKR